MQRAEVCDETELVDLEQSARRDREHGRRAALIREKPSLACEIAREIAREIALRSHSDRTLADASPLVLQGKLAKYGPLAHDPNERRIGRVAVGGGLCRGLDGLSGGGLGDVSDGHDALPRLQDVPEEVRNQRPSAAISSHQEAIRSHQEAIKTFIASASLSAAIRRPPGGHQEPSGAIKHPPRHR